MEISKKVWIDKAGIYSEFTFSLHSFTSFIQRFRSEYKDEKYQWVEQSSAGPGKPELGWYPEPVWFSAKP